MPAWTNGSIVQLTHVATETTLTVLIEKDKGSAVTFCRVKAPYEKLKVNQQGETTWGAGGGKFASFVPVALDDDEDESAIIGNHGRLFVFHLCANQKKKNQDGDEGWYLGVVPMSSSSVTSSSISSGSAVLLGQGLGCIGNASARHHFRALVCAHKAVLELAGPSRMLPMPCLSR